MDLDLFFPRRRNYYDDWESPVNRSVLGWADPFDNLLLPTLALAVPQKSVQRRGASEVGNDPNKFEVKLDCSHFKPEEIDVKTVDNNVIIHGKHEEKDDSNGHKSWVSREFSRKYTLPEGCEAQDVISTLEPNGVLKISAPKREVLPPELMAIKVDQIPIRVDNGVRQVAVSGPKEVMVKQDQSYCAQS